MSVRLKHFRPHNRVLRSAYASAMDIREDTRKGVDRKADAARLMREIDAIAADILEGAALNRNRVQHLQNRGINSKTPGMIQHLKSLGPMGIRGMIPAIIAGVHNGDEDAELYASAMVTVLDAMPQADRPMSAKKFAQMIPAPDYEKASVELEECQFMLDALALMLPRLANGQLPTSIDMLTIGEKQRQLRDGQGLRDAETLFDDDVELSPAPEKETADETPDSAEHSDPANLAGQDRSGEADPSNTNATAGGEADPNPEDQSRPSGTEGE